MSGTGTSRRGASGWGLRRVVAVVLVVVLGLGGALVLLLGPPGDDTGPGDAATSPSAAPSTPSAPLVDPAASQPTTGRSLRVPDRAGPWRLVDPERTARSTAELRRRLAELGIDLDVLRGEYDGSGDARLSFQGYDGTGEDTEPSELADSPTAALQSLLQGQGLTSADVVPAGPLRGAMVCGSFAPGAGGDDIVVCGWADRSTVGVVSLRTGSTDRDEAARVTRAFRERVTVLPGS